MKIKAWGGVKRVTVYANSLVSANANFKILILLPRKLKEFSF